MDLKTALGLIKLQVDWINYSQRLAAEESGEYGDDDLAVDDLTPEEAISVYTDPVFRGDGTRWSARRR